MSYFFNPPCWFCVWCLSVMKKREHFHTKIGLVLVCVLYDEVETSISRQSFFISFSSQSLWAYLHKLTSLNINQMYMTEMQLYKI